MARAQYQELRVNRLYDSNLCTLKHIQPGPPLSNSYLYTLQTEAVLVKKKPSTQNLQAHL